MARSDTEQLVVSLEARIRDFEKNFAKANRTANRQFGAIERRGQHAADKLERTFEKAGRGIKSGLSGIGKGIAGGLLGGLAVAGVDQIVDRIGGLVRSVGDVGREARRSGLGVKEFQELKYVAEAGRVPVDALIDGMKELAIRGDEFVLTGKGGGADAFQRLGFSATELSEKLKRPNELLEEIFRRAQRLDKAAQIRVFDEIFGGTGGERMVELLAQGADGIKKMVAEAHELGAVLSDELVSEAERIDAKFAKIGRTISNKIKKEVVETVQALEYFLDRFKDEKDQQGKMLQNKLADIYSRKSKIQEDLVGLGDKPGKGDEAWARRLKLELELLNEEAMRLVDILDRRNGYSENFIFDAGEDARETEPKVKSLNDELANTGNSGRRADKGIKTFADGLRALKKEIPELAAELRQLDSAMRIEAAYQATVKKARTMGEVQQAGAYRDQALAATRATAAGSDSAKYLGGIVRGKSPDIVQGLRGDFADALARMIASAPDKIRGKIGINSAYRSPEYQAKLFERAVKKYGSVSAARKWVAPPGKSQHGDGEAVDLAYGNNAARKWMHANAGRFGLKFPMKHEPWHIEPADARKRIAPKPMRLKRIDEGADRDGFTMPSARPQTDAEREAARAVKEHNHELERKKLAFDRIKEGAGERLSTSEIERQSISMTAVNAAALRNEHEMLQQAQRQGIELTSQQRQEISSLARQMAEAETSLQSMASTTEQQSELGQFFGQSMVDGLSGIITGTQTAETALRNMLNQLVKIALQGAIMGEGPLGSLFSGGGLGGASKSGSKGGKSIGGGLLGGIIGLASGGPVNGRGTSKSDSIPALLSNGEYVVNARSTRKHRALLQAINSGHVPAFASGGMVGSTPPNLANARVAGGGAGNQSININAPITVEGSGGTPEQNDDLSRKMRKELEGAVRGQIAEELRQQQRAGNMLARR